MGSAVERVVETERQREGREREGGRESAVSFLITFLLLVYFYQTQKVYLIDFKLLIRSGSENHLGSLKAYGSLKSNHHRFLNMPLHY